ncbi:MAG: cob(I)yrinic acid a,c-diamide adenosyltransferase [Saccharofermentanales bacterium]|jgi:monoterpene epsilon-lactone hydrolase
MTSIAAGATHRLIKARMEKANRSILEAGDIEQQIAAYRRVLAVEAGAVVLGNCRIEEARLGQRPALWFSFDGTKADRVVLFLYGGGYVGGTLHHNRNMASGLVRAIGQKVVALDYRVAPEDPFPAALEDVLAAYDDLLEQGFAPRAITLLGCSAGGGLALAAALAIRDSGRPQPGALVGLSPWFDLTLRQATIRANNGKDIVLKPLFLEAAARLYAKGKDRSDPLISPLYGDLTGLPPILLQIASEELFLGEVIAVADKAEKSGVQVKLEIWEGLWHVWQAFHDLVPEARAAQDNIGRFIREHTWPAEEADWQAEEQSAAADRKEYANGLIHVLCGNGRGKTTSAIGLIIRAAGHGQRTMLVQFLKNGQSGEIKALRTLPGVHVISGPEDMRFSHVMSNEDREEARERHHRYLAVAVRAAQAGRIDLLVLDEVLDAVHTGLLSEESLLMFLKNKPADLEVVLTGRDPSEKILSLSDYISDIRAVRHPFERGVLARKGVEY